jgi:hypothetical protein
MDNAYDAFAKEVWKNQLRFSKYSLRFYEENVCISREKVHADDFDMTYSLRSDLVYILEKMRQISSAFISTT